MRWSRAAGGIAVLTVACAPPATQAVGFSAPRSVERSARVSDGGLAGTSPVPSDFRKTYTKVGDRFLSDGHARRYQAMLWLNGVARDAWAALPAPMPEGALVVEEALDAAGGTDKPAGLWVMEKKGGAWRFVAVSPEGEAVSDARVALCAECHAQAPHDGVFVEVTPEGR
jgi:hypothetical protein